MTDDEIAETIRHAIAARRGYADDRSWPPDRSLEELGVAQDFIRAAGNERGAPFSNLKIRPRGEDPPDCEALDSDGRRIAIEITELVDRKAVELVAAAARPSPTAEWTASKFIAHAQERLTRKDIRDRLKDGPYDEYIVVIYTAEPQLNSSVVFPWLQQHRFIAPAGIDRAYLSLDYEPGAEYPLVRLQW